jgi:hypothetical protein
VEKYSSIGCRITGVSCYLAPDISVDYCSVATENCSPCAESTHRLDVPAGWTCSCEQDFYSPLTYFDSYGEPQLNRQLCRLDEGA